MSLGVSSIERVAKALTEIGQRDEESAELRSRIQSMSKEQEERGLNHVEKALNTRVENWWVTWDASQRGSAASPI